MTPSAFCATFRTDVSWDDRFEVDGRGHHGAHRTGLCFFSPSPKLHCDLWCAAVDLCLETDDVDEEVVESLGARQ